MRIIFKIVVIVVCLAVPCLVSAEIYKWLDVKGTIHFTDDPATIPEKYWDETESRTTEEDHMTMEERIRAKQDQDKRTRKVLRRGNRSIRCLCRKRISRESRSKS